MLPTFYTHIVIYNMENTMRKGAWTKEEDVLLTKCIQQYGEGRWYLVPPRAGLNRCRKSCRMRWLNYLKPSLKRGSFAEDEVDLLLRMHKLIGNRWSLIAGRLPGRTANDIKNFWNSHITKKSSKMVAETSTNVVIRPQPRNLSMSRSQFLNCATDQVATMNQPNDKNVKNNTNIASLSSSFNQEEGENIHLNQEDKDESMGWWTYMLQMSENGEDMLPLSSPAEDDFTTDLFADSDVGLNI